jgi:hypothetical protein
MGTVSQATAASSGTVATGLIKVTVDGFTYRAKGEVEFNLGLPKRELITGVDGHHGYKEVPQEAYVGFKSTDGSDYDLKTILTSNNCTVVINSNNGKTVTFSDCFQSGEGTVSSEESEFDVRWTSLNQGVES